MDSLDADVWTRILQRLSTQDMARFSMAGKAVWPLVEDTLQQQVKAHVVLPQELPQHESSWMQYLFWLHRRSTRLQVSMGYHCAAAVDGLGRLLTWGRVVDEGILGQGPITTCPIPTVVPMPFACRVRSVSMGTAHTLISTEAGIFSFGIAKHGRLGHNNDTGSVNRPRLIESLRGRRAVSMAAGGSHSLILADDGLVHSFGYGANGQLGHRNRKNQLQPKCIGEMKACAESAQWVYSRQKITAVAAGNHHSLVLVENGRVWSFGRGFKGRLGHGSEHDFTYPTCIRALTHVRVTAIAAGDMHSLVLSQDGACYSFGDGSEGQLGHGNFEMHLSPTRIEAAASPNMCFRRVAAGATHSLVLDQHGDVRVFGKLLRSEMPPLAEPHTLGVTEHWCHVSYGYTDASPVDEVDVIGIAAGDGAAASVLSNGQIRALGEGCHG
jgi:alpha-tubulin suppressor-like RCC1 family protein